MKKILFALALTLAACTSAPEQAQTPPAVETVQGDCAARGGQMQRVGRAQTLQCVIPYADAGKACRDGGECASGRCQGPIEANPRENVIGQCQATNMAFGCYTTITNGRTGPAICVD
jgi:hypothetical protein